MRVSELERLPDHDVALMSIRPLAMTVGIWARPTSSDVSLPPDVFDTFEDPDAPGYTAAPTRD